MRLELSRLVYTADPTDKDLDYHKVNRFFDPELCSRPEFMFKNHLIKLKDTEIEMLQADLALIEDEERRRVALESQEGTVSQNIKTKADPKKDKAKGGKGVVDDKNAPKTIEIDYPADVEEEPNFILLDKLFNPSSQKPADLKAAKPVTAM